MPSSLRSVVVLTSCLVCVSAVAEPEPTAKPKAKVELRWVETRRVEGLTETKGFQSSCDPDSIVYPHKKPALVLTPTHVTEARLSTHDFSGSGLLNKNYMVTLHLTKDARSALAATCEGEGMRLLTVVVDGKYWGVRRYEKGEGMFVPEQSKAESFLPDVGFFSSKADAQRLVDAFK